MNTLGQLCLLVAFVGSGYGAFAGIAGWFRRDRTVVYSGNVAAMAAIGALTLATAILAWALLVKDFGFAYVVEYSSRLLPWHYSLSALWVGQAGSLLLWAWLLGAVALVFRFQPRRAADPLRDLTFAILMAGLCFLVAIMVFAADPMKPSLGTPREGIGLSPLLQHPAMLIHPPIVFLGYAGWAVPFALAMSALLTGRLDDGWTGAARRWALFAWAVLGGGILFGAVWAYEELGWGGYWAWDPVENGSLIPWLTGTALLHTLMAWQYRNVLKKTTLCLAVATFGLCNLATFLTRSGIFSSLHAFSESPIGWMFLALMVGLTIGGGGLVILRRATLHSARSIPTIWAREAMVVIASIALLLLATVALVGTLAAPLSGLIFQRSIVLGTPFYNNVLIPTGLLLLATTAVAPLLRWGNPPTKQQRVALLLAAGIAAAISAAAFAFGVRQPIALAVTALAAMAVLSLVGALLLDIARRGGRPLPTLVQTLVASRRKYAGFLVHMGFVCLAIGVTGSSLGTDRCEVLLRQGETIHWAGRSIRFAGFNERELPDKLVMEAKLEVTLPGRRPTTVLPAQHMYRLDQQWTTEVAIHSTWGGDLYTILRGGEEDGSVRLTLIENPLMRWIWLGGWVMCAGVLFGLWPTRSRKRRSSADRSVWPAVASQGAAPPPHFQSGASQRHRIDG